LLVLKIFGGLIFKQKKIKMTRPLFYNYSTTTRKVSTKNGPSANIKTVSNKRVKNRRLQSKRFSNRQNSEPIWFYHDSERFTLPPFSSAGHVRATAIQNNYPQLNAPANTTQFIMDDMENRHNVEYAGFLNEFEMEWDLVKMEEVEKMAREKVCNFF
jgi:hypothetical protein